MQGGVKKKLIIIVIAILSILIIASVTSKNDSSFNVVRNIISVPLAPFQKAIAFITDKFEDTIEYFGDIKNAREENIILRDRVRELENQNKKLNIYIEENRLLKQIVDFKDQYVEYDYLGSTIISKDPGNWFYVFTIDRGIKDKVTQNSPVITGDGLVGRVTMTELLSSKVTTIIDIESSISARLVKSRDLVVVKGDIKLRNRGLCRLDYLPPEIDVEVGDLIETSGLGGVFPKGIIIGKITEIVKTPGMLEYYAIVKPAVDFKRLEEAVTMVKKETE